MAEVIRTQGENVARRVHPCLCGFSCKKLSCMRYHRLRCAEWHNRPNPRGLMLYRRSQSLKQPKLQMAGPCVLCGSWINHTHPSCLEARSEQHRLELLFKHGIDPADFEQFLRVLAKRYQQ